MSASCQQQRTNHASKHGVGKWFVRVLVVLHLLLLLEQASARCQETASRPHLYPLCTTSESSLGRELLQNGAITAPPPPLLSNANSSKSDNSSSKGRSGNAFSAFVATTVAASTGAIGVVSGMAGVAAANLGAGTVIQAAGALNMQATSAAVVQMIQHIQVFASMDAPVQQLVTNSTTRDSFTKNITDALSWITFSTRNARCKTGNPGDPLPNDWERSRCLWRSGKNHVAVIAIVLGVTIAVHAMLVLLWNFTIGYVKPMPVVLVPPNLELMLAGIFVLPLAAAATQLIAADTWQSSTLATFVIAFLGMYFLFLVYVLMGIVAQKQQYGLVYKRSVYSHGRGSSSGSGQGGQGSRGGTAGGSGTKHVQHSGSLRRACMNVDWPQWHGEWEVAGVPEDQRATYRKQYVRISRWYAFVSRVHRHHPNPEAAKVVSVEIEDRLGALHDPYRGDNLLAYNWELVKLGYLIAQGTLLAATEASLEVGAMSWSLLWLQVAYTGLMTAVRPFRNQWLGFLDVAANWVRVGTFIAFIQLANKDKNLQKNMLSRLELASMALVLLSAWVRILSMFIKVEGIYFAIKRPRFLTWTHKSIKHTLPFTAAHIDRVEESAAHVERVRSGQLPSVVQDSSPLLNSPDAATANKQQQQQKPSGQRVSEPVTQLPHSSVTAGLLHNPILGKERTAAGKMTASGAASTEQVKVQVPGSRPAASTSHAAAGQAQPHASGTAASMKWPGVSHLPAIQVPLEEIVEEDKQAEHGRVPLMVEIGDDYPTRLGSKRPKPVLDRPPSLENLGQLWEGGLDAGFAGPAGHTQSGASSTVGPSASGSGGVSSDGISSAEPVAQPADSTQAGGGASKLESVAAGSPAAVQDASTAAATKKAQFETPGQTYASAAVRTAGVAVVAAAALAGRATESLLGPASERPPSGGQTGSWNKATEPNVPLLGTLRPLGMAAHQRPSFSSEGADVFHSMDSDFDEAGRLAATHLGLPSTPVAGEAQGWLAGPLTGSPATLQGLETYQDIVVDEILKGMLFEIMTSRPSMSFSSARPHASVLDTAEEDVEETLQRVLGHMHTAAQESGEEQGVSVGLLRSRLHHLHQDLVTSWQQEPTSPLRPHGCPTAGVTDAASILSLRRAYTTARDQAPTAVQRLAAMRVTQSMPAAMASGLVPPLSPPEQEAGASAAQDPVAGQTEQTGRPLLGRSHTSAAHFKSPGSRAAYRQSQTMPAAVAAAAAIEVIPPAAAIGVMVAAELQEGSTVEGHRGAAGTGSRARPLSKASPSKELSRVQTSTPSHTTAAAHLQHSQTMPAGVAAAAQAAAGPSTESPPS